MELLELEMPLALTQVEHHQIIQEQLELQGVATEESILVAVVVLDSIQLVWVAMAVEELL
jgi:acyl carrier protein